MSKPILRHYGKIVNGKKEYFNPILYKQQLDSLEGQEFEEVIKKRFRKVSEDAHAYYRGAILRTAHQHEDFIHFDKPDDIHDDIIVPMFLSHIKTVTLKGRSTDKIEYVSTGSLNKEEMSVFIERVLAWLATEHGITVLSPEQYYESLHN